MNAQAQAKSQPESPALTLSSDLLTGTEWSAAQVQELFRLATDVKAHPDRYKSALAGRFLAMIFEKPSLRTRVTFEVGIASMGGTAVYLDHADTHLGDRESIPEWREAFRAGCRELSRACFRRRRSRFSRRMRAFR